MALSLALIAGSIASAPSLSFASTQITATRVLEEMTTQLGPEMSQTLYKKSINSRNQRVYKFEANPKNQYFELKSSLAGEVINGRETTTNQANRVSREGHRVIGAVNGDFYNPSTGNPIGAMVSEGEIITTSNDWKGFGIMSSGEAIIGTPRFVTNLSYDGKTVNVNQINRERSANNLILYTPKQGNSTKTNEWGMEVVLRVTRGRVEAGSSLRAEVESIELGKGDAKLGQGRLVLSAHGAPTAHLSGLKVGQEVDLSFSAQGSWQDAREIIGGKDILIQDGRVQPNLERTRHPRTALGVKADGNIIAVVVDGRQPGFSEGVGLDDLAKMMLDMGAVDAINLDGGGSSTFASRKPGEASVSLVNRVSDGSERAVANSVLFISTASDSLGIVPEDDSIIFKDMVNQWSRTSVESLYEKGIVSGLKGSDGRLIFDPDRGISRQEFAKLIVESEELEVRLYDNLSEFSDADSIDGWAKPYISTAYKAGLIQGLIDESDRLVIGAKDPVTKYQIATIIGRTMGASTGGETSFKDNDSMPEWAKAYVVACLQKGIVNGTPEGYFEGDKSATRAESAVMIHRFLSTK